MPTETETKTVLLTGFGPFGKHGVNASWEAVKEVARRPLPKHINLAIYEISVEYDTVSKFVPELWKKHKPDLVIHVGVSGIASEVTLEQQAHNDGYHREDVKGCKPEQTCCIRDAEPCLQSEINMDIVCNEINQSDTGVKAIVSHDPGRYLCDFSFYTSLSIDKSRTAFIHVPPIGKPYTTEQLAEGLLEAIVSMLKQVS